MYYFEIGNENCYTLDYFKKLAKEEQRTIEIVDAKMVVGEGVFYCSKYQTSGDTSDSDCGISCEDYAPRNKVSGRCIYHKNCYEPTTKKRIIK